MFVDPTKGRLPFYAQFVINANALVFAKGWNKPPARAGAKRAAERMKKIGERNLIADRARRKAGHNPEAAYLNGRSYRRFGRR